MLNETETKTTVAIDPLRELERWMFAHKSRTVSIDHDDGYGSSCWEVRLCGELGEVRVLEPTADGDQVGLAETISVAIKKAEALGMMRRKIL